MRRVVRQITTVGNNNNYRLRVITTSSAVKSLSPAIRRRRTNPPRCRCVRLRPTWTVSEQRLTSDETTGVSTCSPTWINKLNIILGSIAGRVDCDHVDLNYIVYNGVNTIEYCGDRWQTVTVFGTDKSVILLSQNNIIIIIFYLFRNFVRNLDEQQRRYQWLSVWLACSIIDVYVIFYHFYFNA